MESKKESSLTLLKMLKLKNNNLIGNSGFVFYFKGLTLTAFDMLTQKEVKVSDTLLKIHEKYEIHKIAMFQHTLYALCSDFLIISVDSKFDKVEKIQINIPKYVLGSSVTVLETIQDDRIYISMTNTAKTFLYIYDLAKKKLNYVTLGLNKQSIDIRRDIQISNNKLFVFSTFPSGVVLYVCNLVNSACKIFIQSTYMKTLFILFMIHTTYLNMYSMIHHVPK